MLSGSWVTSQLILVVFFFLTLEKGFASDSFLSWVYEMESLNIQFFLRLRDEDSTERYRLYRDIELQKPLKRSWLVKFPTD